MLFNSFSFLVFFPIVCIIYFILPDKIRWGWLLLSSCIFYMAYIPWFILVIASTIVIDYFAGRWIESSTGARRKHFLLGSLMANIGILFFFKYFHFFTDNIISLAGQFNISLQQPNWHILLPVGLSFHTFQAMSYTIEVYRGNQTSEKHFGMYALYVMFFPQMVAGPIERPQHMLPQFHAPHIFDEARIVSGLRLMLWGFFKKIVIADRAAIIVDQVYGSPHNYGGLAIIWSSILFAFQIYCDFSGYSDIAIGAARVLDFKLMTNFKRPYFSASITEFWHRWHISLSSWFRDYLYIPLGGSHINISRTVMNLFITFLISGLWHGADWKFVIWGGLNGFFIVIEYVWKKNLWPTPFKYLPKFAGILWTFLLITISWIFFAAHTVKDAFYMLTKLTSIAGFSFEWKGVILNKDSIMACLFIFIFITVEYLQEKSVKINLLQVQPTWIRWSVYIILIWIIFLFGQFSERQFIYFVF
ncbi:MAG TPA: MBOAT family O-acyltransferase [Saprospiraceae bacterium]|nr:MBOAT family O-acyltransferase [Saprospiraceae bacterium]